LNSENGNDVDRRPKPKKKRNESPEVGHALRSVYQRTVNEDIPPEMLDLLGKLG
jgi:Anti-sigma factor NepR